MQEAYLEMIQELLLKLQGPNKLKVLSRKLRKTNKGLALIDDQIISSSIYKSVMELPIFDQAKRQGKNRLPFEQHGFVKSRLAMFDQLQQKPERKLVSNFLTKQKGSQKLCSSFVKPKASSEVQNVVTLLEPHKCNPFSHFRL